MALGKERRRFKRYKYKSEFILSIGNKSFKADTIDFSLGGLGLFIEERVSIPAGSRVNFRLEDLNLDIDGRIVWSQQIDSRVRAGIERLSISGSLKYYPIYDILLDLQRSEKDGILEIRKNDISKRIYIKNGDMIFATSNLKDDRLGNLLLRTGKISIEQFNQSVNIMMQTGKRQGTILVELGYLKPEDLIRAVRQQVEEIIISLFQFEDGEFTFLEGALTSNEVIKLNLSAANLIYSGIMRIDDISRIKRAMPSEETIFTYSTDPMNLFQDINFNNTDREILSLIDGKRSIKEILSLSLLDYLNTIKIIFALLSIRIIEIKKEEIKEYESLKEFIQEPEVSADSSFVEMVSNTFDKLKNADFYSILGVDRLATHDKIKKSYYNVAKIFHPDRHFSLPSEDLKNKLNTIFSYITEAYRALSDPKMRHEYDQRLTIKPAKIESNNVEIARKRFREGIDAFKRGSYNRAVELFGQATYLDNKISNYHFYFGLALEKSKRYREAEKAFRHALKISPFNADYITELGHIYLKLGLKLRAKSMFEKALKFEPSHERAIKGIQQVRNHS